MGKTSRWFRRLLGLRKQPPPPRSAAANPTPPPQNNCWGLSKSSKHPRRAAAGVYADHATDTVGHKAAEVVGGRPNVVPAQVSKKIAHVSKGRIVHFREDRAVHFSEEKAAIAIQAHFRSYLARRALRALKSLVKLQALVRGHIMRKQTAYMIHRMQSLLRVQARARAGRVQISDSLSSSAKSSQFCHPGPATPEKFEHVIRSNSSRRDHSPTLKINGSKSTSQMIHDQDKQQNDWYWSGNIKGHLAKYNNAENEKNGKIVEIDNVKSHFTPKKKNIFHSTHLGLSSDQLSHSFSTSKDSTTHQTVPSPCSYEVRSFSPLKATQDSEDSLFCTAQNSPQFYSASSRGGSIRKSLFTPTKSDGSKSYLSGYSDHPNYMAYTESSKAKIRSVSAPRQRTQMERSGSARRYLVYNNYDEIKISAQRASAIRDSFVSKGYPGSGRLDRLGLPMINNCYLNGY